LVVDGAPVAEADAGQTVAVVLNQTPFYAESGGQVGDTGRITGADGLRITVTDTQKKLGSVFVHLGRIDSGTARVGAAVVAEVDHTRRGAIRAHHSATHLLHEALRRRMGTHVTQKGSLNAPDRLRFDVSQPTPIGRDDLAIVEAEVNARIRENAPVETRLMTPDEAVAEGAMALFGEKYGDEVRVVSMGDGDTSRKAYSIELCGGTHVRRTGDIGLFRIVSEGAVSAGVRRIEAVVGSAALAAIAETERRLNDAAAALRTTPAELPERLTALVEDRKRLERQVADLQRKLATGGSAEAVEEINGIKFAPRNLGDVAAKELKGLAEAIGKQLGSGVVALVSSAEGKASVVVGVSPDLTARFSAVDLVRAASAAVGGKGGGGRPDMAQAGGPDAAGAEGALEAVRQVLRK
jgi:alanyl-tRNA synthetase